MSNYRDGLNTLTGIINGTTPLPIQPTEIMIDLETLGKSAAAPVIEIAMVEFDLKGATYDSFETLVEPNLKVSQCDFSTITWWTQQSEEARRSVFNPKDRVMYNDMLDMIDKFILGKKQHNIWCHATFDMPILSLIYHNMGRIAPWGHRNVKDIRTLTYLAPNVETPRLGINHTAKGDCLSQIRYVTAMLNKLRKE